VFLYSAYPHRSPLAERMRAACRDWRDLPASDEDATAMLREDNLDVLVDLAGHTPGGRLGVLFARLPAAPFQSRGSTGSADRPFGDRLPALGLRPYARRISRSVFRQAASC
jgi:predicted O-linked N-acetylglucosamine transferase (SPINDLY family)